MRYKILLFLCFLSTSTIGQIKKMDLYGSWVATRVVYLSGDELPDENILKYTYVKYNFTAAPDKIFISGIYSDLGRDFLFKIVGDKVEFSTPEGFVTNTVRVLEFDQNKLVVVQSTNHGFTDPWAIKHTFIREDVLQDAMPLAPSDIFRVQGTDTLYRSGQKIYAQFNEPIFMDYISFNLHKKGISVKTGELLASFIVNKDGIADSLKILQGINPRYDKAYTDIFNSAKRKWTPAHLNGKNVSVLMQQKMKYLTAEEAVPSFFNGNKANKAYNSGDFELALLYFDLALESRPEEKDYLYRRGICKQRLGNLEGACLDWQKVKSLGGEEANAMIDKFCK